MSTFSFIHAADLHLDTPFTGIRRVDEDLAASLQDASLRAFDAIIDLAIDRGVEFVLFAGDIYDGADRGLRAQVVFKRGLHRLDEAGIAAFVIHGNHDPLDGWSLIRQFPENTHVFGTEYEVVSVRKDGEVVASIHGISYESRHVKDNLALRFEANRDGFQIGLLHTDVDTPNSPYAPCSLEDLVGSGMDYWALGHIHTRRELCREPLVVYPGNHQGRSFNEEGARGVSVVQVAEGRIRSREFVPVDQWRFATLEVDAEGIHDLADLTGSMVESIESTVEDRSRVVRVRVSGRSHLHQELSYTAASELLDELRSAVEHIRPRVWVDRIDLRTRPTFDLDRLRERDDFVKEFIELSDDWTVEFVGEAVPKNRRARLVRYLNSNLRSEREVVEDARDLSIELLLD